MVNAYNPTVLLHWQANMDIQLVNGPIGVAYYVCSYICKSEPNTLKHALGETLKNIEQSVNSSSLQSKLCKIGFCVLKHRTLSAQEAAYRIGHLQLTWFSRDVIKVACYSPENQFKKLKPQSILNQLSMNSSDIFENNIYDYYYARPQQFETMSLFTFCREFRVVRKLAKTIESYRLSLTGNVYIQKRNRPAVVRTCKPRRNSDEYYMSYLLLFLPHRHAEQLISPYDTIRDAFTNKYMMFDKKAIQIGFQMPELESIVQSIELSNIEIDTFAPNTHEVDCDPVCLDENFNTNVTDGTTVNENEFTIMSNRNEIENLDYSTDLEWHRLTTCINGTNSIKEKIMHLTNDQKQVFAFIRKAMCKKEKFHIFVTGGAGVGKSYLIEVLIQYFRLCTASFSGHNPVLVLAPTGVAAHNIKGQTIHSALKLPVQHGYSFNDTQLSASVLKKLRIDLKNKHTVIIDEISMVSSNMLELIHNRLQTIHCCEEPFGGINMIVVGDFFQLRPVRGDFAFKHELLWHLFTPFFLKQNMRQCGDIEYAKLLNRIRIGQLTFNDVETLKSRIITQNNLNSNLLYIYATRKQVENHNSLIQNTLNSRHYTIRARHYFSEQDMHANEQVSEEFIPEDDRDAGGLPSSLTISVGSRVMLLRNLCLQYGLINGACGVVTHIQPSQNESILQSVSVKFNNSELIPSHVCSINGSVQICMYKQEFLSGGRFIIREIFPISPCWAATVHKVQGLSLDEAALSLNNTLFQHGQAYVALSRVRTLQSVQLLSLAVSKITANKTVIEEYLRLHNRKDDLN